MANGILYLSNDDVKRLLDLGEAIDIVKAALQDHSAGRVGWSVPEDLAVKPEDRDGSTGSPVAHWTPRPASASVPSRPRAEAATRRARPRAPGASSS